MPVKTSVPVHFDRTYSPKLVGEIAKALEASGVVDYFQTYDQLTNLLPNALWTPDVTPMANVSADCDSFADGMLLAAFGLAATEGRIGLAITTDAVRRGPAELAQSTMTLANAVEGNMVLMLGAGELKQCRPYGYKRSQGLSRLGDHLQLLDRLYSASEPFDFEGTYWNYKGAWVGGVHPHRPKVWAMGGGPRLVEMATRWADGISASVPCAFATPEAFRAVVEDVKEKVAAVGRDPEQFDFSVWIPTFLHDDPAVIEEAFENPLLKMWAAVFGRFHHGAWAEEGLNLILDEDFHYAMKAVPTQWSREECEAIVAKVPRAMIEKSVYAGSVDSVAATIGEFVDAGATHVAIWDFAPMTRPIEEAPQALARSLELCGRLK